MNTYAGIVSVNIPNLVFTSSRRKKDSTYSLVAGIAGVSNTWFIM